MSVILTAHMIRTLVEYIDCGDGHDTLEVEFLPEGKFLGGQPRPAGVYFWDHEYPDEGCMPLPESPESETDV